MNANDGISDTDTSANNSPQGNATEVIAVIKIRNKHLKEPFIGHCWRWYVTHNRFEERCHVLVVVMQLAHGETVFGTGVNDREIELLIGGLQLDEKVEDHVEDFVGSRILPVDLVDD